MILENELKAELKEKGADFVHFVDISQLPNEQTKSFPRAILLGITLSAEYLRKVTNTKNYVRNMVLNKRINEDEFHLKELEADRLADYISNYIKQKGFAAYSQSEENIEITGYYNKETKTTPLPHKTIALLAGLGWIGKHNLLVTPNYGSAICMCTVLTDAPVKTVLQKQENPQCGSCKVCVDVCPVQAIKGNTWNSGIARDEMVNVYKCNSCIECLVFCPFTQNYMKKES